MLKNEEVNEDDVILDDVRAASIGGGVGVDDDVDAVVEENKSYLHVLEDGFC